MKCQQCLSPRGEIAEYRVYSDVINVKVCRRCAEHARAFGLTVTKLGVDEKNPADDDKAAA